MRSYEAYGFVNTKAMYERALAGHYAVPGYNFNTLEQVQAIVQACIDTCSPVLLQYFVLPEEQLHPALVLGLVRGAAEMAAGRIDVAFHLDHGSSFEQCKACIDGGYSSVMIDGSQLPHADNVAMTREVVSYAHDRGVTVEGELGGIAGRETADGPMEEHYTKPDEVEDFVAATGVDSLAVSVGTVHGASKNLAKPGQTPPPLRLDILEEVKRRLPGLPVVLHGASAIPQEHVRAVNAHGGSLTRAVGIPDDQIRAAIAINVCKVNIHSDTQIAMTGAVRTHLVACPGDFDPRTYLDSARKVLVALYSDKNRRVLGSAGKASTVPP
ncbi:MAG: ketose-bisphosphate aldolase [Candidatus Lokiarchaeota archaeon]|nr:ketose-bisphosphate aldolase [Candidatus Lokiarchaeota archaeon]